MNAAKPIPATTTICPTTSAASVARFELIFASLWLAFGLFVLPALIFWAGSVLLGA